MSRETWENAEDGALTLEDFEDGDTPRACWVALDLGATKDLTAVVIIFEDGFNEEGKPTYVMFGHGFTPAATLKDRAKRDKARYDLWVEQGDLTATPGPVVRNDYVAQYIADLAQRFDIQALVYDRWLFNRFEESLDELNLTLPLVEHPQGFKRKEDTGLWMPSSVDALENLLLEGRLRVGVNAALRSAVASAVFYTSPAGLRRFEKGKATARIDMAVAAAMACGAASENAQNAPSSSYLETMDMLVL